MKRTNREDYAPRDGWKHVPMGESGSCWRREGDCFYSRVELVDDEVIIPSPRIARETDRPIDPRPSSAGRWPAKTSQRGVLIYESGRKVYLDAAPSSSAWWDPKGVRSRQKVG